MSEKLLFPDITTATQMALLGYAVVFLGIVLLLAMIVIMGKIIASSQRNQPVPDVSAATTSPGRATQPRTKGTAGGLKLHNVEPRDAAMIMAIVSYRLGVPLNELRFRSIKEVKGK